MNFEINDKKNDLGILILALIVMVFIYAFKILIRACIAAIIYTLIKPTEFSFVVIMYFAKLIFFLDMLGFGIKLALGKTNIKIKHIDDEVE